MTDASTVVARQTGAGRARGMMTLVCREPGQKKVFADIEGLGDPGIDHLRWPVVLLLEVLSLSEWRASLTLLMRLDMIAVGFVVLFACFS